MVLIDSHTISKSIENNEKVDDIFDSITDLDPTRSPPIRRDRFIHKYKPYYKDQNVRTLRQREAKYYAKIKTTDAAVTTAIKTSNEHPKPHKSPKRRVGSFWRKFRGKDKKIKHNDIKERQRRISENKKYLWKLSVPKYTRNLSTRNNDKKNKKKLFLRQNDIDFKKRDVNSFSQSNRFSQKLLFSSREHSKKYGNKLQIGITPHLGQPKVPTVKVSTANPLPVPPTTTENIKNVLAAVTTHITELKHLYGLDKYRNPTAYSMMPIIDKNLENKLMHLKDHPKPTNKTTSTTDSLSQISELESFSGTAQLEELLNDIKIKALKMVTEHYPSVADVISDSVADITLGIDSTITKSTLAFVLSESEIGNSEWTVAPTTATKYLNSSYLITNTEPHYLKARSIKEDTMTMARHVEDVLQRELKNIYNKMKNKVSKDVHKVKTTVKETVSKIKSKLGSKSTKKITTSPCKTTSKVLPKMKTSTINTNSDNTEMTTKSNHTTAPRYNRGEYKISDKKHSTDKVTTSNGSNTDILDLNQPSSTYDDYMMLTLYEQMLSKTQESNDLMKMLTTPEASYKKRRQSYRLSKRNSETLSNVNLREDVQKLYNEINMPDYDYVEPSLTNIQTPESTAADILPLLNNQSITGMFNSTGQINYSGTESIATQSDINDSSYQGLSDKISYNDFVNGYKHYLKFQKEQGNQNFSNLVRYQAHKHHSVDDIGKFILNKIPQVPTRWKRFFDDSDIDDQELSTKTDDSWFKKHFYLFIDNGPPKKFHTSQTVSLKSAATSPDIKVLITTDDHVDKSLQRERLFIEVDSDDDTPKVYRNDNIKDTAYMSLDDLSVFLNSLKDLQTSRSLLHTLMITTTQPNTLHLQIPNQMDDAENLRKVPQNFMDILLRGQSKRDLKKYESNSPQPEYETEIDTYIEGPEIFTQRCKRSVTKEEIESTIVDDIVNKDLEEKISTKQVLSDVAIRSNTKEPNKYGYVDIDLVPQQTAVVKLRESTSKKSRIKEFFRKFHFKKDKNKKHKRDLEVGTTDNTGFGNMDNMVARSMKNLGVVRMNTMSVGSIYNIGVENMDNTGVESMDGDGSMDNMGVGNMDNTKFGSQDNMEVENKGSMRVGSMDNMEVGSMDNTEVGSKDNMRLGSMDDIEFGSKDNMRVGNMDNTEVDSMANMGVKILDDMGVESMDNMRVRSMDNTGIVSMDNVGVESMDNVGVRSTDIVGAKSLDYIGVRRMDNMGVGSMDNMGFESMDNMGVGTTDIMGVGSTDNMDVGSMDNMGVGGIDNMGIGGMENMGRRPRFNPLKKLKDMFKVKTEDAKATKGPGGNKILDYETIDSIKPPKFSKTVMSIEDLKKQIPNISDVNIYPGDYIKPTTIDKSVSYKLDESDRNLVEHFEIPTTTKNKAANVTFTPQVLGTDTFKPNTYKKPVMSIDDMMEEIPYIDLDLYDNYNQTGGDKSIDYKVDINDQHLAFHKEKPTTSKITTTTARATPRTTAKTTITTQILPHFLDNFKPIKYKKPLSIEEILDQIPTIYNDMDFDSNYNSKHTTGDKDKPIVDKLDDHLHDHVYHDDIHTTTTAPKKSKPVVDKLDDNHYNHVYHDEIPTTTTTTKSHSDTPTKTLDVYHPLKYSHNKTIPSVDDLEKQDSNINNSDSETDNFKHTNEDRITFKMDDRDRTMGYHDEILNTSITTSMRPATVTQIHFTPQVLVKQEMSTKKSTKATAPHRTMKKHTTPLHNQTPANKHPHKLSPSGHVITVNIKAIKRYEPMGVSKDTYGSSPSDYLKLFLNNVQDRLTSTVTYDDFYYITPHDKQVYERTSLSSEPLSQIRSPLDELTIRSKLTRIAKFPIKKSRDSSNQQDLLHSVQKRPANEDFGNQNKEKHTSHHRKKTKLDKSKTERSNLKNDKYTDYFNDLLMWHKDILNLDKVPSPAWHKLLTNIQGEPLDHFTTPNKNNLMKELDEINEFLNIEYSEIAPPETKNANSRTTLRAGNSSAKATTALSKVSRSCEAESDSEPLGIIKSLVMDDRAIVTSKDIMIKGEAKYFQYHRPTTQSAEEEELNDMEDNEESGKLDKLKVRETSKEKEREDLDRNLITSLDPAILVDTTLLAYDDDVDSITRGLEIKKLSRNSQKSNKGSGSKKKSPLLKTNKAPIQYYNTPLPMKPFEFEKFLKENEMDVESVTSPMIELPSFIESSWNAKQKSTKGSKLSKLIPKIYLDDTLAPVTNLPLRDNTRTHETKTPDLPTQRLNKMSDRNFIAPSSSAVSCTIKLIANGRPNVYQRDYKRIGVFSQFDRFKRGNLIKSARQTKSKTAQEANYYNLLKKKLFEKKVTSSPLTKGTTQVLTKQPTVDPQNKMSSKDQVSVVPRNKEVEITIINFDDIDKKTTTIIPFDSYTLPPFRRYETTSATIVTEPFIRTEVFTRASSILDSMHNELIYKDIFKEHTTSTTTQFSTMDFPKSTEYIEETTTEPRTSVNVNRHHYPLEFLNKLHHVKNVKPPQRIHISSHHYKYDIFYNDDKKTNKMKSSTNIFHRKLSSLPSTTVSSFLAAGQKRKQKNKRSFSDNIFREPDVSTEDNVLKIDRVRRTRRARDATTSSAEKDKPSASLIYDLKHLRQTTLPHNKERHRRLFKISSLLQDRFKALMKNTTTTSSLHISSNSTASNSNKTNDAKMNIAQTKATKSSVANTKSVTVVAIARGVTTRAINTKVTNMGVTTTGVPNMKIAKSDKRCISMNFTCIRETTEDNYVEATKSTTEVNYVEASRTADVDYKEVEEDSEGFKVTCGPQLQQQTESSSVPCVSDTPDTMDVTEIENENEIIEEEVTDAEVQDSEGDDAWRIEEEYIETEETTEPSNATTTNTTSTANTTCAANTTTTTTCTTTHTTTTPAPPPCCHHHPYEPIYIEPSTYEEQVYYEEGVLKDPPKAPPKTNLDSPELAVKEHNDKKRDVQNNAQNNVASIVPNSVISSIQSNVEVKNVIPNKQNTFTAKDVAALEVIVDLMKNTLSYEEKDIASVFNNNYQAHQATKSVPHANDNTNSIQVHIAIPYDFQNGKKRSPLDPIRVRKVFSAKMSTPVDLEYQVHSFEGFANTATPSHSSSTVNEYGLSPGMYLLVDKPKNGYALKPVKTKIDLSELKTRQACVTAVMSEASSTSGVSTPETREMETTSLKSLAKVTLSKDFIAAVNQQLIEMYENMTRMNRRKTRNTRSLNSIWNSREDFDESRRIKNVEDFISKIRIDWDAVREYFGHDRVCNCKCRPNKAMCSACAASDAVIDELIFEFDNLGNYMRDHCTEIQTFFWMNPSGGQKLRDAVSRIDKSLENYYKRVKGKCQGRTCKTFTTYIDKRNILKITTVPQTDVATELINDLQEIAEDLNKTISLRACFNEKLKDEGDKLLQAINVCLLDKPLYKRSVSNTTKRKLIKNVYSLDNINVNIICNPESPTVQTVVQAADYDTVPSSQTESTPKLGDHLFDYEIESTKHKKRKGFKKLFPRKNRKERLFTYYVLDMKKTKLQFKRDLEDQITTPLIADGGGAFWYDYLKGESTLEPRFVRESSNKSPKVDIAIFKTSEKPKQNAKSSSNKRKFPTVNTIYMTVKTIPKREVQPESPETIEENTSDYLTDNINQLLQLFGSLQDIETLNMHSNRSTMFLTHSTTKGKSKRPKTLKKINSSRVDTKKKNNEAQSKTTKKTTTASSTPTTALQPAPAPEPAIAPSQETTSPSQESSQPVNIYPPFNISASHVEPDTANPLHSMTSKITGKYCSNSSTSSLIPSISNSTSISTNSTPQATLTPVKKENKKDASTTKTKKMSVALIKEKSQAHSNLISEISKSTSLFDADSHTHNDLHTEKTKAESINPLFKASDPSPITKNATGKKTTASNTKTTTISTSFLEKLKTATYKFISNIGDIIETNEELETETQLASTENMNHHNTEEVSTTDRIERLSELETNLLEFDISTPITTQMNPTIVIINEYDNQISNTVEVLNDSTKSSDSDGYKNLLLSIIQFETNKLNDEWNKLALGVDKEEADVKRSIIDFNVSLPRSTCKPYLQESKLDDYTDVFKNFKSLKNLEISEPTDITKKPTGLLDKIVSSMKGVAGSRKKAVKKLREATKKPKKANKNKKNKDKIRKAATTQSVEEACDSSRTPKSSEVCDIQATYAHILDLQKTLPVNSFETLVRNISCYKYKTFDNSLFIPFKSQGRKWDWIRNKRSLKLHFTRIHNDMSDEPVSMDFDNDYGMFERYVKGNDGIYKILKRKKRTVSMRALDVGLRNIPPLIPDENEVYAMQGDTITLECLTYKPGPEQLFSWKTDRDTMFNHENVNVNGVTVTINDVQAKNVGRYMCTQGEMVLKNIVLLVMTVPAFDTVFLPTYKMPRDCSYDDLKAIQNLGTVMAAEAGCGDSCSIRIDEPVCQRDRGTNSSLLRTTAVLSLIPKVVNCSIQCRRDIVTSLVMLCASNTPILTDVEVVVSRDGVNETLTPCKQIVRPVLTHSLRKKDSNNHYEYHKLVPSLAPGKVDVVLICPAGFYLLQELKMCATCPPNTSSSLGDNTCTLCPRGTRSDPGSSTCTMIGNQVRRYDWWWYPPCGYMVAASGLGFGCLVCLVLAMIIHIITREPSLEDMSCDGQVKKAFSVTATYANTPRNRPLSPSRVILARFFKPSLTSSRATDSQETKFELWKERNIPPPLPPIDFDI